MTSVIVSTTGTQQNGIRYVGSTQVAIQLAINFLLLYGGGKIFIEKGIYTISSPINLESDIEICGEGRNTVLRSNVPASGTNAVLSIVGTFAEPKENVYIHDLLIGNNVATKVGYYGIYASYVGRAFSTGLSSGGFDASGRLSSNMNKIGVVIENCVVQNNNSHGIYTYYYCSNCTIAQNIIWNNNSDGVNINQSTVRSNTITGNIIQNNTGSGIYVFASSENILSKNIIGNNGSIGIYLHSAKRNTITGNTVQNNTGIGMQIYLSDSNTVTGNTCQNNGTSAGILIHTSHNNTITGNTWQNNTGQGLYLNLANNNTITGNTCQNNGQYGLYISGNNNTITANTYTSTYASGTGNVVIPNIVH